MSFDELVRPAARDLDWSDVEADAARMEWEQAERDAKTIMSLSVGPYGASPW